MPTSVPGSNRGRRAARRGSAGERGFTLIELLVVVAIVALTTAMIALALRDDREQKLEREGDRLVMLLETARAESRAAGLPVGWRPSVDASALSATPAERNDFQFVGLPASARLPSTWLEPAIRAEVEAQPQLTLGPEALIGAQRVWLRLEDRRIAVATDGLAPFAVQRGETP